VGMANSVQASRVEEATNLYAISDTCTIAIRESLLCDELDGLRPKVSRNCNGLIVSNRVSPMMKHP
jgi:hypothetical protein